MYLCVCGEHYIDAVGLETGCCLCQFFVLLLTFISLCHFTANSQKVGLRATQTFARQHTRTHSDRQTDRVKDRNAPKANVKIYSCLCACVCVCLHKDFKI